MRAARLVALGEPLAIEELPIPEPGPGEVVVRVAFEGICRTDWHTWVGDWSWVGLAPPLPITMGHEFAGEVSAVGEGVRLVRVGDRVAVPFHEACGNCPYCRSGRTNLCDALEFLGMTHDGGYAEYVRVLRADLNCVPLPDGVGLDEAAALGCRFMTAWHALAHQAGLRAGEWLAVHGVGGVGLSAVQIGAALGARVVAVDIDRRKLDAAQAQGAMVTIDARSAEVAQAVREATGGGADVALGGLGTASLVQGAIRGLRKGGRLVQVGLTSREEQGIVGIPLDELIEAELTIVGSVGNPHVHLPALLSLVAAGRLDPAALVTERVALSQATGVLERMTGFDTVGFALIDRFDA
ncbi:MAG TPA: alcohol dehydrogenase catalytic domain-containing protein [Solirubrobacteraceae bacterium]|nr:alcohol dehydrogenase catalytic domain-containing protein [Solirubrobacteraceae bacterium]